jgi:hypothetical protein
MSLIGRGHRPDARPGPSPTILVGLALVLLSHPTPLEAQGPHRIQGTTPSEIQGTARSEVPIAGVPIPGHLEGLEEAMGIYLQAWNGEDPGEVLSFLAPGAQGLTRGGVLAGLALEELIAGFVPHLGIRGASIYLVEESNGWVSLGTYLAMESLVEDDGEATAGTMLTVWERGPDLRWRVLFLRALWMEVEEVPLPRTVVGPRGS